MFPSIDTLQWYQKFNSFYRPTYPVVTAHNHYLELNDSSIFVSLINFYLFLVQSLIGRILLFMSFRKFRHVWMTRIKNNFNFNENFIIFFSFIFVCYKILKIFFKNLNLNMEHCEITILYHKVGINSRS